MSRRDAHPLGRIVPATWSKLPGVVRFSTAVRRLRENGTPQEHLDDFERERAIAAHCPTHGALADPVIGIAGDRVAFICPWCSDDAIREAWEQEGKLS